MSLFSPGFQPRDIRLDDNFPESFGQYCKNNWPEIVTKLITAAGTAFVYGAIQSEVRQSREVAAAAAGMYYYGNLLYRAGTHVLRDRDPEELPFPIEGFDIPETQIEECEI